jgi:hypothetical protein
MTYKFSENVREHTGVKIHHLAIEQNIAGISPEQAAMIQQMVGDMTFEMAFVGDVMVYAMGPQKIEELIDAQRTGRHATAKPLAAQQLFGPGAQFYFDLDVVKMLQVFEGIFGASLPPDMPNPIAGVAEMMSGAEPITAAAFIKDGRQKASMMIPNSLISGIAAVLGMGG